jgi:hypothetical protein
MLKKLMLTILVLVAIPSAVDAKSVKGVVVYDKGCRSYFIVQTAMGYALLQWYGGKLPSNGDEFVGDFEMYGMKDIYNLSSSGSTKVWVDEFWLSKSRVLEKLADKCS